MARKPAQAKGATPKATRKDARSSGARQGKPTASAKSPAVEAAQQSTSRDLTRRSAPQAKYSPAQIIAALEASAGIYMGAARILNCRCSTISNYVKRYKEIQLALDDIMSDRCSIAEGIIIKRMGDDKHPVLQFNAAVFYLKTKGKHLGYVEGKELTGTNGGPIQTQHVGPVLDTSALSDDELEKFGDLLSRTVTLSPDEYDEDDPFVNADEHGRL